MAFPKYVVLSFTLNHQPKPIEQYSHEADFVEGDKRSISYVGDNFIVDQTFYGDTNTGGWYDND